MTSAAGAPRRRWNLRVHDVAGGEVVLVVEVPPDDGMVRASVGGTAIVLSPEDVSRVRRVYQEAQAVALQDRGRW